MVARGLVSLALKSLLKPMKRQLVRSERSPTTCWKPGRFSSLPYFLDLGKELLYLPENPKAKFSRQNSKLKSSLDDKFKDPGPALRTGEERGLLIATPSTYKHS